MPRARKPTMKENFWYILWNRTMRAAPLIPSITAIIALIFAFQSVRAAYSAVKQSNQQLALSRYSQQATQYDTAVSDLGSSNQATRLAGVYQLQRFMLTNRRANQPAIINILSSFIRSRTPLHAIHVPYGIGEYWPPLAADVQAALDVMGHRNPAFDGDGYIDLSHTDLVSANLMGENFSDADFIGADLAGAELREVNFTLADLSGVNMEGDDLTSADLYSAQLGGADLSFALLEGSDLSNVSYATTGSVDTNFRDADLTGSDLRWANLFNSDFRGAQLQKTKLSCSIWGGTLLKHAVFALPAHVKTREYLLGLVHGHCSPPPTPLSPRTPRYLPI
jgi:uncharacterized protein YjbI with pentapeptide repeats